MTIRRLIALLQPYAVGAEDGAECEVTVDGDEQELVIDMGSDIHRYRLDGDE
jgi:hypothetical protein